MPSNLEYRNKAESLLVRRLRQLEKRGRVTLDEDVASLLFEIENKDALDIDDLSERQIRSFCRMHLANFSRIEGFESTLEGYGDKLASSLYSAYIRYNQLFKKECEKERAQLTSPESYFEALRRAETLAGPSNIRFIG